MISKLFCQNASVLPADIGITTWTHYDPEQEINKWRKTLEKFQMHKNSACRIQAMMVWEKLREGAGKVDAILDREL